MFNTICIKPNPTTFPTDIGLIAENLLFYNQVVIVAGVDTLQILFNECPIELLIELVAEGRLRICIRENILGVQEMVSPMGFKLNDVTYVTSKQLNKEQLIYDNLFKTTGRQGYSKRNTQKLLPYIEAIQYDKNILDIVREDINNETYLKSAILESLKIHNPYLDINLNEVDCFLNKMEDGFILDFSLNNNLTTNNPEFKTISKSGLILNILETQGDMHLASKFNSDIATTALNSKLLKIKFKDIYTKTTKNTDSIYQFNDFVLSNGFAIREAINSKEKSFKDFVEFIRKADKFRSWLDNLEGDQTLIKEYHIAVTKETWIDKLPSKTLRWGIFTGAGLALDLTLTGGLGTAIGIGLSAGDAFLLDKLAKGWKPNTFIEQNLKGFLKK